MTKPEAWERAPYPHPSGRVCFWRRTWVGNPRDGHWRWGYWYGQEDDPDGSWRFCGQSHG